MLNTDSRPAAAADPSEQEHALWDRLCEIESRLELLDSETASAARVDHIRVAIELGLIELARCSSRHALDHTLPTSAHASALSGLHDRLVGFPGTGRVEEASLTLRRRRAEIGSRLSIDYPSTISDGWRVEYSRSGLRALFDDRDGRLVHPMPISRLRQSARDQAPASTAQPRTAEESPAGIVVDGLASPYMLEQALAATPAAADGHRPRVTVIETDALNLHISLALFDDAVSLDDDRIEWFIGDRAADDFRGALEARIRYKLPGTLLASRDSTSVAGALHDVHRLQRESTTRLERRITDVWLARSSRDITERFQQRIARSDGSLRVMIVTSRYSTFVQHSARDVAEAMRSQGIEAHLVMEPTDQDRLTSLAVLQEFDRIDPDLVFLINHTVRSLPCIRDTGVPSVCWIQDRLLHLFDTAVGDALGPRDFVIGHMHTALFDLHAWDRDNAMFSSVPASPFVFHSGPVEDVLQSELSCDIAYVGHQSSAPDVEHRRIRDEIARDVRMRTVLDAAYERLRKYVIEGDDESERGRRARSLGLGQYVPPATLAKEMLQAAGWDDPPPETIDKLQALYFAPMAELLCRNRVLTWAGRIAEEHGLRMHVYGNGWDQHPVLHRYARRPLTHGEELRAAYQCAGVHLHASLNTNAHQRVAECALSGGLMLRAMPSPDARTVHLNLARLLYESRRPDHCDARGNAWFTLQSMRPATEACAARLKNLRYLVAPTEMTQDSLAVRVDREWIEQDFYGVPRVPLEQFPDYAFESSARSAFWTEGDLESIVLRATSDDAWRSTLAQSQRAAAEGGMTYPIVLQRVLQFVAQRLVPGSMESAA